MNLDKLREVCGVLTRARRQLDSADQPWITDNVVKQLDQGILIMGGLIAAEHDGKPCEAKPKSIDLIKLGIAERLLVARLGVSDLNLKMDYEYTQSALSMATHLIKGCS